MDFRLGFDLPEGCTGGVVLDRCLAMSIAKPCSLLERIDVHARPTGNVEEFRSGPLHEAARRNTVSNPSGAKSMSGALTRPSASRSNNAARTTLTSTGWNAASIR